MIKVDFLRRSSTVRMGIVAVLTIGLFGLGFVVASSVVRALAAGQAAEQNVAGGALVDPPHHLQDFTLTSQTGAPISLSDLRGKAVLLFFGYTHCPDVCPTTLGEYLRVKQALGDRADEVAFVFVSVDGRRDTPDVIRNYLGHFDPDFIGMTGDEATLRRVGAEYGLLFETDSTQTETHDGDSAHTDGEGADHTAGLDPENYFVQHSSPSFLIDRDGDLRMLFFAGSDPADMVTGIRQVLN